MSVSTTVCCSFCCAMVDEGEWEEDWTYRDEEEDAYASEDYHCDGGSSKKKRRLQVSGSSSSSSNTTAGGRAVGYDREAPLIADAFRGHHCPICLGSINDSAMIGVCRHVYCKTCLFEVRRYESTAIYGHSYIWRQLIPLLLCAFLLVRVALEPITVTINRTLPLLDPMNDSTTVVFSVHFSRSSHACSS